MLNVESVAKLPEEKSSEQHNGSDIFPEINQKVQIKYKNALILGLLCVILNKKMSWCVLFGL